MVETPMTIKELLASVDHKTIVDDITALAKHANGAPKSEFDKCVREARKLIEGYWHRTGKARIHLKWSRAKRNMHKEELLKRLNGWIVDTRDKEQSVYLGAFHHLNDKADLPTVRGAEKVLFGPKPPTDD